jgi:dinuclear metal center YbgI/SA1388 family protein
MPPLYARDLIRAIESFAPLTYAQSWDNVGLLVGSADQLLSGPVYLTIDLTESVLDEAIRADASAIIAYHPPIWTALKRITADTPTGRIILRAAQAGLAVYSPHTALDAMPGGMTDWLCEGLSTTPETRVEGKIAGDCRALEPIARLDERQQVKIVTFVPPAEAVKVRDALASAGAGLIGAYSVCSFTVPGTGTFLGGTGSHPSVGQPGRLEQVDEHRLEIVCSRAALALAIETLKRFHPYEEPVVDVYELVAKPQRAVGAGRRLVLDRPAPINEVADRLKSFLGVTMVKVAAAGAAERPVTHIGVVPGAGADLAARAAADGCEVFVTGEMTHHQVMAALHGATGSPAMGVILAGHANTERGFLKRLAGRLTAAMPGVEVRTSRRDVSPFTPR